jgi:hypothetical protein
MSKLWKSMERGSKKIARTMTGGLLFPKHAAPPLPLPDEEEIKRNQRRTLAARAGKTGRGSTILSGNDEPLG